MDTATLQVAYRVMTTRNIRGTARAMKRPVPSIASAITRLEHEISVPLVRKAGAAIVLTLDAERILPHVRELAEIADEIMMLGTPARRDLGVTLKALTRFATVAEIGSIRGAAKALGVGQPQLTRQIGQIETILGCRLLTRGVDGSRPTQAGMRLLHLSRTLESKWIDLARAADGRSQRRAATIRMGSIVPMGHQSFVASTLAKLIVAWSKSNPHRPLFVTSTTTESLIAGLKRGLYDVVLLNSISIPDGFQGLPITKVPLSLVGTAETFRGVGDIDILIHAVKRAPLALPGPQSGLRQIINSYLLQKLNAAELEQMDVIEVDSMPVIINMVLKHGAVSILPSDSVRNISDGLVQSRLPDGISLPYWLVFQDNPRSHQIAEDLAQAVNAGQRS